MWVGAIDGFINFLSLVDNPVKIAHACGRHRLPATWIGGLCENGEYKTLRLINIGECNDQFFGETYSIILLLIARPGWASSNANES